MYSFTPLAFTRFGPLVTNPEIKKNEWMTDGIQRVHDLWGCQCTSDFQDAVTLGMLSPEFEVDEAALVQALEADAESSDSD